MLWITLALVLVAWLADRSAARRRIARLEARVRELHGELLEAGREYEALAGDLEVLAERYADTRGIVRARLREILSTLEEMGKFVRVANVVYGFGGKARRWAERKEAALREVLHRFAGRAPARLGAASP